MYLKVKQLSEKISVHRSTIYRWMKNYTIPFYKIGGRILFKESEIEEWMEKFAVRTPEDDIRLSMKSF